MGTEYRPVRWYAEKARRIYRRIVESGMGREGGAEGIRNYLEIKLSQQVWA